MDSNRLREWDKLLVFYYVAKFKSITKAGQCLNVAQPSVSRTISLLEASVKNILFTRVARGVVLTKAGQILFDHVSKVMTEVNAALKFMDGEEDQAEGKIKILTTHATAYSWMVFFLPGFLKACPDIKPIITCEDATWDMTYHDVAIMQYLPGRSDLIQVPLTTFHMGLFASPKYLKEFGTPQTPEDLNHHQLIVYGENSPRPSGPLDTLTQAQGQNIPYIQINSLQGRFHLAELGMGIAEIGKGDLRLKNTNLVEVLSGYKYSSVGICYIYHKSMQTSKRVTALLKYFENILSKN